MTDAVRPLIAGNWKMNGLKASMTEFEAMLRGAPDVLDKVDLLVCPPVTLLATFRVEGIELRAGGPPRRLSRGAGLSQERLRRAYRRYCARNAG